MAGQSELFEKAEELQERFYSLKGKIKYKVLGHGFIVGMMLNYMGHDRKPLVCLMATY